jgi:hypothetical protein
MDAIGSSLALPIPASVYMPKAFELPKISQRLPPTRRPGSQAVNVLSANGAMV